MNRQFKFRICYTDQNGKKSLIYSDNERFLIGLNGKVYENYGKDWKNPMWEEAFDADELPIVQQYTGLTDKNNKEIFEGDIINFIPFGEKHTRTGVIVFENACYMAKSFNDVPQGYHIYFHDSEPEVVGNIYDLPCKPDHNGECMLCDELCSDCPFRKLN